MSPPPPLTLLSSVKAAGTHIVPLNVVKLGFVLNGHDFDGDSYVHHHGQHVSQESTEDQETYRYDQLKAALAALITQVSVQTYRISLLWWDIASYQ